MARKYAPAPRTQRAWDPVFLEPHEISDIKAIAAQHKTGFHAIVQKICRLSEMSFAAGGEDGRRETDYAEGKRSVGNNLVSIVAMKMPTPEQKDAGPHAVPKGAPPEN